MGCLRLGSADSQTRLIDVQSYVSHLRLACSCRMAAGQSDDAREETGRRGVVSGNDQQEAVVIFKPPFACVSLASSQQMAQS